MEQLLLALTDEPEYGPRDTDALLRSLATRIGILRAMSGSEVVGSMIGGLALLGREVAQTASGARMRAAIVDGVAESGNAIWRTLHIQDIARVPATPILDQLRNDVALLAADDLESALKGLQEPARSPQGNAAARDDTPVEFADYLLGMWAYGWQLQHSIERLLEARSPVPEAAANPRRGQERIVPGGPLLR